MKRFRVYDVENPSHYFDVYEESEQDAWARFVVQQNE